MSDAATARRQMLIAAFYARDKLSSDEKAALASTGLFKKSELDRR